MPCLTYIIYSKTLDKFYVGHTCDELTERLKKHNSNHKGFTRRANDWSIVFTKSLETKAEAYQFERQIKSWKSRKKIVELINKQDSAG